MQHQPWDARFETAPTGEVHHGICVHPLFFIYQIDTNHARVAVSIFLFATPPWEARLKTAPTVEGHDGCLARDRPSPYGN